VKQRAHLAGRAAKRRLSRPPLTRGDAVDRFHLLYYEAEVFGGTWKSTHWMGVPTWKCPSDLWVYQELLYELRPDLVIETGTAWGGSALYLASLFDLLGQGRVISVDLRPRSPLPLHPRITYLHGSSTDRLILEEVKRASRGADRIVVILDSDHRCDHVLEELRLYSPLVPLGSYLVVEDTNINGHPAMPEWGPGPMEAVERFLADHNGFVADRGREKFLLTLNPGGFLRRVR
jgi:cephalosporin hydroxylase